MEGGGAVDQVTSRTVIQPTLPKLTHELCVSIASSPVAHSIERLTALLKRLLRGGGEGVERREAVDLREEDEMGVG